jgi:hypothetical protein
VVTLQRSRRFRGPRYWAPFAPGNREARSDLLIIGGRSFYALATNPQRPMPTDYLSLTDVAAWESWGAIDAMLDQFLEAISTLQGFPVPAWVRNELAGALGC